MLIDFTIIPLGVGVSLSQYVACCHEIFEKRNMTSTLHANGTNLEGEWDEVMGAIKECHELIHQGGVPRIASIIKVGTRTDREQTMNDKIKSVKSKLHQA